MHFAAEPHNPRAKNAPFVFENIAPGKYDVALSPNRGALYVRRKLVVSPDDPNPTVTVEWPHGTASIRGTVDRALRDMTGPYRHSIRLYSADVRWSTLVPWQEEGRFELAGIPAGDYTLMLEPWRSGCTVPLTREIRLAEGEAKTLDLRKEGMPQSELLKTVIEVGVFTPQGIILPGCDVRLAGANGALKPTRSFAGKLWFAAPPGTYQLSAAYPGASPATHAVEIKPAFKIATGIIQDRVVNLILDPGE